MNTIKTKATAYSIQTKLWLIFLVICSTLISCSTSKNTTITRAYHNLTAHYNVYFNANESLKAGNRKISKSKEDYSRILPVFKYEDENTTNLVASDMDLAVKKCAKTIKTHSLTVKPKMKKKGISQKEKEFLQKNEYCNWIDDAYLVMGKAHFFKRDFETAKQTFLLNINKYPKESSKDEATLWLAKTYGESKEFQNAEGILIELRKGKSQNQKFMREVDLLYASMYLKQKDYVNASQKLNAALGYKIKKDEKVRLNFLLAQIYQHTDQYQLAIENYKKVIKKNPNYDITFQSKINLAEIYEKSGGNAAELKRQFLKLLKDEKNVDYYDQLYYALAKIELNQKNMEKAIEYYKLSSQSKSSSKTQKTKTYLALADLYYSGGNYFLAEAYYDSTASVIDPKFPDYENIYPSIKSRKALTKNLNIISTEDSLQAFAKLSDNDKNRIIDGFIQKIREQEQKALQAKQNNAYNQYQDNDFTNSNPNNPSNDGSGKYYFYNTNSLSYGQTEFKKKWGDRKLEDNWRRSNKQAVMDNQISSDNVDNQTTGTKEDKGKKALSNKTREFYLQDVPTTPEKLEASNKKVENALLNSGTIYSKDFKENKKAIKQFESLLNRFPKSDNRLEVLQKIHALYIEEQDFAMTDKYKQIIISEFPQSLYAKMLSDPAFVQKVKKDREEIEKLYQTAYERYNKKEYIEAIGYCVHGLKNYPDNELSAKFIFLRAMSYAESGNKPGFKEDLETLILKYPNEEVTVRASAMHEILTGKKLEQQIYFPSKDSVHFFVLVYQKEKIDDNKLKFKFISLNAQQYTQDDYKILIQPLDAAREMLIVKSFKNSQVALSYYQKVITQGLLQEYSTYAPSNFIISSKNFEIYFKDKDDAKYMRFFGEQYLKN